MISTPAANSIRTSIFLFMWTPPNHPPGAASSSWRQQADNHGRGGRGTGRRPPTPLGAPPPAYAGRGPPALGRCAQDHLPRLRLRHGFAVARLLLAGGRWLAEEQHRREVEPEVADRIHCRRVSRGMHWSASRGLHRHGGWPAPGVGDHGVAAASRAE